MVRVNDLKAEISAYYRMLGETESKKRRYQLHRHINKLKKELSICNHYLKQARR